MKNTMIKKIVIVALIAVMVGVLTLGLCACDNNSNTNTNDTQEWYHFDEAVRFDVIEARTNVMDMDIGPLLIPVLFNMAFDRSNTYIEFKPDGKMHFQLQTHPELLSKTLDDLLAMLKNLFKLDINVGEMLSGVELTGMLNDYVEPMFPGFTAKIEDGDLEGALNLISRSLGLNIVGLDYSNAEVKKLIKEIGTTKRVPADLLDRIPSDTVLTLTWDSSYYIWDVTGHDGKTYKAIAIGELGKTNDTEPWCTFDLSTNADGVQELFFRAEFMMSQLAFKQHIEQSVAA